MLRGTQGWLLPCLIGLYLAGILYLSRGITVDYWDGIKAMINAVLISGQDIPGAVLDAKRPPAGWLAFAPVVAAAYKVKGPWAALKACHVVMPFFLAGLLFASHILFTRLFTPGLSLILVAVMAANPLLIQYAPFALLDIFSGLGALLFLWAAWRCLEAPSPKTFWLAFAAYLFAFLSKYHLGLLILAPLAYRAFEPVSGITPLDRVRRLFSPLWAMPPLCYVSAVAIIGLLSFATAGPRGGLMSQIASVHSQLATNLSSNVFEQAVPERPLYVKSLWNQLGPVLFFAAAWGLWTWLKERKPHEVYLALALILPVGVLSVFQYQEQRYIIPFLPIAYAALGRGLDSLLARTQGRGLRQALLLLPLVLIPWKTSLASARYLRDELSVHTKAPWELAKVVEDMVPPGACVGWEGGLMSWRQQTVFPIGFDVQPQLAPPTMAFFTRRGVKSLDGDNPPLPCEPVVTVVPNRAPQGLRWEDQALARVYDGARVERWRVYLDRTEEAPRR